MRINNTSVETLDSRNPASTTQKVAQQSLSVSTSVAAHSGTDQASLSGATSLVALAKTLTSASRQAKIDALTGQVRAGSYQGDVSRASQAMVKELSQTGSSSVHK